MAWNGRISVHYFSLENNGLIDSYIADKNAFQVINENMYAMLNNKPVALLKKDEIVAVAQARKLNQYDCLNFYFTDNFQKEMTFSGDEVRMGSNPGYLSFNLYKERGHGNNEDHTRTTERILRDKFDEIAAEKHIDDLLGVLKSGKNIIYRRNSHGHLSQDAHMWSKKMVREPDQRMEAVERIIA